MSIDTPDELRGMQAAGRVVAAAIAAMRRAGRPGLTTAELDAVAARVFAEVGARSGPQLDYDFPGVTCISVNDEVVHGIPGPRRLRAGDLVKLDVTAELDGFYADACETVAVGRSQPAAARLAGTARRALTAAMSVARAGEPLNGIGKAVEETVSGTGFGICAELTGHGIGRRIHEPPNVPNRWLEELDQPLTEGLVMTIEPILAAGSGTVYLDSDQWTVKTTDRSLAAHAE